MINNSEAPTAEAEIISSHFSALDESIHFSLIRRLVRVTGSMANTTKDGMADRIQKNSHITAPIIPSGIHNRKPATIIAGSGRRLRYNEIREVIFLICVLRMAEIILRVISIVSPNNKQ